MGLLPKTEERRPRGDEISFPVLRVVSHESDSELDQASSGDASAETSTRHTLTASIRSIGASALEALVHPQQSIAGIVKAMREALNVSSHPISSFALEQSRLYAALDEIQAMSEEKRLLRVIFMRLDAAKIDRIACYTDGYMIQFKEAAQAITCMVSRPLEPVPAEIKERGMLGKWTRSNLTATSEGRVVISLSESIAANLLYQIIQESVGESAQDPLSAASQFVMRYLDSR